MEHLDEGILDNGDTTVCAYKVETINLFVLATVVLYCLRSCICFVLHLY